MTSAYFDYVKSYFMTIKSDLQSTERNAKIIKLKNILAALGYRRRSQLIVDEINIVLDILGLNVRPAVDMSIPLDTKVLISIKDKLNNTIKNGPPTQDKYKPSDSSLTEPIQVKYDFLSYLFDVGSEQECERLQACLDSNQPIGIFLVPLEEDFFSEVVIKVLNYELVRKYQYAGIPGTPQSSTLTLTSNSPDLTADNLSLNDAALTSGMIRFDQETMHNVLLGKTGLEMLDSEQFDNTFDQISLYTHKYNNEQFFVIFHCPSELEIRKQGRLDLFGNIIDKISGKLPFTFTLKCKYSSSNALLLDQDIYKNICSHFKLLMEIPSYESVEDESTLLEYFVELQKVQTQLESQLLLRIEPHYFNKLIWGYESTEHIYLKYFAIRTLEDLDYDLTEIHCERSVNQASDIIDDDAIDIKETTEEHHRSRPDVYVDKKIIVEAETLRSKEGANNVFLNLIHNMLDKAEGWGKIAKELWIALPGFEIARNYYQVKKIQEILTSELSHKFDSSFRVQIMIPDYQHQKLVAVSFDQINYPPIVFNHANLATSAVPSIRTDPIQEKKICFKDVVGLVAEKEKLRKLLLLQEKGLHTAGIRGILLFGLPGCGKTLLSQAFAGESNRYFFNVSPADIGSKWIGESQQNIRRIFAQAKKRSPSVLFIDELDSVGFSRVEEQAHTDQKSTINQILIEFNALKDSDVVVIATTNFISVLDSALIRSGRLGWKIPIFPPEKQERRDLFRYYLSHFLNEYSVDEQLLNLDLIDFDSLADRSKRFVSSDIEAVCQEVTHAVVLEEIGARLTTSDVSLYIDNLQESGLTLTPESVNHFIDECRRFSIKSHKVQWLEAEWK
jgi:ATP-dependent 26S proteasome regulatory subunit